MAYLKPPWFTVRVFNRIAMALGFGAIQTLVVTRRGSKQPQRIPVVAPTVPVERRAPIIAAYRPLAGKVVDGYWRGLPNVTDHPIFALTPTS